MTWIAFSLQGEEYASFDLKDLCLGEARPDSVRQNQRVLFDAYHLHSPILCHGVAYMWAVSNVKFVKEEDNNINKQDLNDADVDYDPFLGKCHQECTFVHAQDTSMHKRLTSLLTPLNVNIHSTSHF